MPLHHLSLFRSGVITENFDKFTILPKMIISGHVRSILSVNNDTPIVKGVSNLYIRFFRTFFESISDSHRTIKLTE